MEIGTVKILDSFAVTAMSVVISSVLGSGACRAGQAGEKARPRLDRLDDPLPPPAVLRLGSTRLRPGGAVTLVAFSPDGSKIAAWCRELYVNDGLSLWDVRTGRLLRRVDMPGVGVPVMHGTRAADSPCW